jgi:hypothetical protein
MQRYTRVALGASCLVAALAAFTLSRYQPEPGAGSWLTELAGDWMIRVDSTNWFIGNSPEEDGTSLYPAIRGSDGRPKRGDVSQPAERDVVAYASGAEGVLVRTARGYAWYGVNSGDVVRSEDVSAMPAQARALVGRLRKPSASYRTRFAALAMICVTASGGFFLSALLTKRRKT